MSIFKSATLKWNNLLRFDVQSEFGTVIATGLAYGRACYLASMYRDESEHDYYVVDSNTKRAVSEVYGFRYDS
jgi:hypothetical protein